MDHVLVILFATTPLIALVACCLMILERCERHLRALHVQVLGPLPDHSPETLACRARELGLWDGYPANPVVWIGGLSLVFYWIANYWSK